MAAAALKVRKLVVERDQHCCARCGWDICGQYSIHHRKPRRMGGSKDPLTHSAANQILLCGSGVDLCHGHIESNRAEALALGWLLRDSRDPSDAPVLHALHGWVLLDTEGGWAPTGRRPI